MGSDRIRTFKVDLKKKLGSLGSIDNLTRLAQQRFMGNSKNSLDQGISQTFESKPPVIPRIAIIHDSDVPRSSQYSPFPPPSSKALSVVPPVPKRSSHRLLSQSPVQTPSMEGDYKENSLEPSVNFVVDSRILNKTQMVESEHETVSIGTEGPESECSVSGVENESNIEQNSRSLRSDATLVDLSDGPSASSSVSTKESREHEFVEACPNMPNRHRFVMSLQNCTKETLCSTVKSESTLPECKKSKLMRPLPDSPPITSDSDENHLIQELRHELVVKAQELHSEREALRFEIDVLQKKNELLTRDVELSDKFKCLARSQNDDLTEKLVNFSQELHRLRVQNERLLLQIADKHHVENELYVVQGHNTELVRELDKLDDIKKRVDKLQENSPMGNDSWLQEKGVLTLTIKHLGDSESSLLNEVEQERNRRIQCEEELMRVEVGYKTVCQSLKEQRERFQRQIASIEAELRTTQ